MEKVSLKDVTFIIPLRIESPARTENIEILISFIQKHFSTNILILEANKEEKYFPIKKVEKIFVSDDRQIFHHTRYRNQMVKKAKTDFIAIWDTDALCNSKQIIKAVELLRKNEADMVYPYDGRCFNIHNLFKKIYQEADEDIKVFEENIGKSHLIHGYNSCGGAFIASKKAFCEAGMENEKIYGWGPEDEERYRRWEILGYRVSRINGPMFHIHHPRGKTSWYADEKNEIRSRLEFLKVCCMNPIELREYVNSWG